MEVKSLKKLMLSDRPNRKMAEWKTALEEIKRCSRREYDPMLVQALIRAFEKGNNYDHTGMMRQRTDERGQRTEQ